MELSSLFATGPSSPNPYMRTYAASTPAAAQPAPAQLDAQLAQLQQQLMSIESQINSILAAMGSPAAPAATTPIAPAPAPTTIQPLSLTKDLTFLFDKVKNAFSWLFNPSPAPTQPGTPSQPPPPNAPTKRTEFVISSFNVLGSSHTVPGRSERPGMATGVTRIRQAAQLLQLHKVDVAGLQEFQPDQVKEFQRVTGNTYGMYPGMQLGRGPNVNSIVWRKDTWDLVKAETIKIPYFEGHPVKMPVVRLRHKVTGQEAYFTNFHNPASTKKHPDNEHWRDVATQKEVDLVNRLKKSGLPVFMTGDFNEREETYDKVTRGADMSAANEGPNGKRPKNMGIDWIFGTDGVTFSHYKRDDGALVDKTSDHPMIVSKARIG